MLTLSFMDNQKAIFDDISDYSDNSRREAKIEEINAIYEVLKECKALPEIGIGTGRISRPLQDRGYKMTGIDK